MSEMIFAPDAPAAVGPYCHARRAGGFLYLSGQLGLLPSTGLLPETVVEQTFQALQNLEAVLKAAGYSLNDVIKTTVFLKNMSDFGAVNEVYAKFFQKDLPARSCVAVAELPKNALFEIEAVAYR